MEPKTKGKRIVSKAEYARLILWKIGSGAVACIIVIGELAGLPVLRDMLQSGALFIFLFFLGLYGNYLGFRYALSKMKYALSKEDAVPLTRANTADLPAPDSLVRASSEPIQAQETVLLRATVEGQERHEEQLLRAVKEPE